MKIATRMIVSAKNRLANALREIGLEELAKKADTGIYNEFEISLDDAINYTAQLTFELGKLNTEESCKLAEDIIAGKYEMTVEEMQEYFNQLPSVPIES